MDTMPEGIRKQLDKSLGNQDEPDDEEESIEETTAKILQFVRKEEPTDESQFATVVVVLPTGRSFTTSVPILNLWGLLEETVWQEWKVRTGDGANRGTKPPPALSVFHT